MGQKRVPHLTGQKRSRTPARKSRLQRGLKRRTPISRIPSLITATGQKAVKRYMEFFAAHIRNRNTRHTYRRGIDDFLSWCDDRRFSLKDLEPIAVAAYVEYLGTVYSKPTVKLHLAALRMFLDWLVLGQVIPANPAASVKGPRYVVKRGKTPVLTAKEARALLDSIDVSNPVGLRDRAIIGTLLFTFARVSALVGMSVADYYRIGRRSWIRLHEKGGRHHEVPAHHLAEKYLDEYLAAAGHGDDKTAPLFRSAPGRASRLNEAPMSRHDVLRMVKRRAKNAGLSSSIACHTFRATGITAYLSCDGTLENAQLIAGHESPRTTKLYDRTNDEITLAEIERIQI